MAAKRYLLYLLTLLPTSTLVAATTKSWLIADLKTTDQPIDPTQTGPAPALHQLQFKIEDEQSPGIFQCSAGWANGDFPRSFAPCPPVEGNDNGNVTFSFAVSSYYCCNSGSFSVVVEEFETVAE